MYPSNCEEHPHLCSQATHMVSSRSLYDLATSRRSPHTPPAHLLPAAIASTSHSILSPDGAPTPSRVGTGDLIHFYRSPRLYAPSQLFTIYRIQSFPFLVFPFTPANKSSSQSKETLNGKRKREERLLYLPDGCFGASD